MAAVGAGPECIAKCYTRQAAVEGDQQIQALLLAHLTHQQTIGGLGDRGG